MPVEPADCRPRRRSWPGSPRARSYPELFRVTGPLLSLVFRTEDVWQRYNQLPKRFGALNQGFPFSPLKCRQGRTRMGGGGWLRGKVYDACSDYVVFLFWHEHLVSRSGAQTGVYSRSSQLFINKIVYIRMLSVVRLVSSVFGCYLPLYVCWILCVSSYSSCIPNV